MSEWVKGFSKTYQREFWFNSVTQEKTWNDPTSNIVGSKRSLESSSTAEEIPVSDKKLHDLSPRVAVIVPFQDAHKEQNRQAQLDRFIPHITSFLHKGKAEYRVFIIEQKIDDKKFNRGQLLNIGFDLACKEHFNIFVFHDVDLLPSLDLIESYTTIPTTPVHIARVWDRYNSNDKYFGGIVAFSEESFRTINGFPNDFWGWGGEDDALIRRVREERLEVSFPAKGTITDLEEMNLKQKLDFLKEHRDWKCSDKWEKLDEDEKKWRENGLSNLRYSVIETRVQGSSAHAVKYTVDLLSV